MVKAATTRRKAAAKPPAQKPGLPPENADASRPLADGEVEKPAEAGWLSKLVSALALGVVNAIGPRFRNFSDRLAAVEKELDPTELARLGDQMGEEVSKGLDKYLGPAKDR